MKLLFAITIFFTHHAIAQDSTKIFLAAGTNISDVAASKKYRFKEFKQGKVLFYDNVLNAAMLNYNFLNGEIMFIAPNGDTLAISNEQMLNIKRVSIDTVSFVYNKGYLEMMRESNVGFLAKKQQYYVSLREKIGGYNSSSATGAISSYSSFMDRQDNQHNLVVRENIFLQLKTDYYIGDSYKLFLPINKKNLDKIFFKKRKELDSYFKEHQVDFRKETDVTSLFIFLTETL